MEIERKFLIKDLPKDPTSYPCSQIEQAYLNENPVLRIRRKDDDYILTYKSKGMMAREENEFPLTKEAYEHLRTKADGKIISKTRYFIRLRLTPSNLMSFMAIWNRSSWRRWNLPPSRKPMSSCHRTGSVRMSPWIAVIIM